MSLLYVQGEQVVHAMLHWHASTVAQNGQTEHWL